MKQLVAKAKAGQTFLASPGVGKWHPKAKRVVVTEGALLGWIQVLGIKKPVVYQGEEGLIFEATKREWLDYGASLGDLKEGGQMVASQKSATDDKARERQVFRSPTSGRFYSKPSPDKPRFAELGDEIKPGQVVCLLEVMKTFNRIEFEGPKPVTIRKILVEDGSDVELDEPLFELD